MAGAQQISWESDLQQATDRATRENKLVLLHFTASWCRPCQSLETFVFRDRRVQQAMGNNCVAVKIDVDKRTDIVREYGVSGVPFDVAITPGGRVVTRRQSPLDAPAYADMIEELDKVIHSLAQGDNPGLNQNLAEVQEQMRGEYKKIVSHEMLAPTSPSHQSPQPSQVSAELKRKSKILNPYAAAAIKESHLAATNSETTTVQNANELAASRAIPQEVANDFLPQVSASEQSRQLTAFEPATEDAVAVNPVVAESKPESNPSAGLDLPIASSDSNDFRIAASTPATKHVDLNSESKTEFVPSNQGSGQPLSVSYPLASKMADSSAASLGTFNSKTMVTSPTDKGANHSVAANLESESDSRQVQPAQYADQVSTERKFALHGKCPVTLLQEGRWVDGDPRFGCVHRRQTYLFSSAEAMTKFQADPDAFSPLLAGFDPVVFQKTGKLISGLEQHGVFMGKAPHQRVVLFSTAESRTEFQTNPKVYIETIRQAMNSAGGSSSPILR